VQLAQYFERSPDHLVPGCKNTGQEGIDGVVFPGIDPLQGIHCFVGRQSILEAVAALYKTTVDDVKLRMNGPAPKKPREAVVPTSTEIS
jgi:hypothetical protein